jgi:ABC-type dipeptide/oligopeptide/nickel transport system permease component
VTAFVIRRLLWTIPLILTVMLVTFALMRGIGGSPFRLEFGGVPYALQLRFERYYGLNDPWFVEFWNYVRHVATFDFGPSLTNRYVTVDQVIRERFPVSLALAALAAAWAVPLGIGLGLIAALTRNTRVDRIATVIATIILVVPVFLFSDLAATHLVNKWHLVPPGWESWKARIVPPLVLGLAPAGYIARLMRAAVVETLEQDYVRTARAKGLYSDRIIWRHVVPNSLVPFLSAAVPMLALLVTGAFFVESAFGIPGAADYYLTATLNRDYPMVMGLTVALAVLVIFANLIADFVAVLLDRRLVEKQVA